MSAYNNVLRLTAVQLKFYQRSRHSAVLTHRRSTTWPCTTTSRCCTATFTTEFTTLWLHHSPILAGTTAIMHSFHHRFKDTHGVPFTPFHSPPFPFPPFPSAPLPYPILLSLPFHPSPSFSFLSPSLHLYPSFSSRFALFRLKGHFFNYNDTQFDI